MPLCPTCNVECHTQKILRNHLRLTGCGIQAIVPQPQPPMPPLPWEGGEPEPILYMSLLADRLGDKYHQMMANRKHFKGSAWASWRGLSRLTCIEPARLQDILMTKHAADVTCLEVDMILRALSLDLRCLLAGDDRSPIPVEWKDRRAWITKVAAAVDGDLDGMILALEVMDTDDDGDKYLHDVLLARVGSISEKLDAIRLALQVAWNPQRETAQRLTPKSKAEYQREIRMEASGKRPRKQKS